LTTNAPPLPILQVPTPPLESPPFTPSNIKPKKIGYFWTGSADKFHKDFLATYSLDDDTFGTLLWVTDVPSSGNDPHHLGPSLDGKTLFGGGLLSLLKTQVSIITSQIYDSFSNTHCRTPGSTSTPPTLTVPSS
jgi:selenium-binding protein 1